MLFSNLCQYFEKISKTTLRLEITKLLAELFKNLSSDEISYTVYLLQGRLGPLYEKLDFGIAEKLIIKSCCLALNIDRKLFEERYKQIGDLGETIFLLKKEIISLEEKDFTIEEIFNELLRLAKVSGEGSQEFKVNLLADLIRRGDPLSAKYLVRIPLGVLRLGFSDMTILDAYSWMITGDKKLRGDIEKAYHVRPELGFIGKLIKEKGIEELKKIKPKVFTPIIMMRAERLSSGQEIIKQLGECLIEPKFDGFRIQVHMKKTKEVNQVKLFSRSLEDVTYMYPDIVEGVFKQIKGEEIIFEGEAVGFDEKNNRFLPFQETVQRKRKYQIEELSKKIPLRLFCFELLYKDGKSFINEPFIKRRKTLEESIMTKNNVKNDVLIITSQIKTSQDKEIDELFDKAVKEGFEGIMAKKIDGVYKPGAREWNWIKYKKSYSTKIKDTIDCLVMGYDLGKGKRANFGIGAFLVGVYDEKKDRFLTVSKIGTGLTDEEWKNLKSQISNLKSQKKPENYIVDKSLECDFWVEPKLVVEIRADEITKSPVHSAGLALRFPRLERFRNDKNYQEVTTLTELRKMSL